MARLPAQIQDEVLENVFFLSLLLILLWKKLLWETKTPVNAGRISDVCALALGTHTDS